MTANKSALSIGASVPVLHGLVALPCVPIKKLGFLNATANTSDEIRLSSRVAQGTRVALQNSKFRLIGRWNKGPLGFNLSNTGVSASVQLLTSFSDVRLERIGVRTRLPIFK